MIFTLLVLNHVYADLHLLVMRMPIFIYSNGCAVFASLVPSNDVFDPVV
jgi:hypothetical protein